MDKDPGVDKSSPQGGRGSRAGEREAECSEEPHTGKAGSSEWAWARPRRLTDLTTWLPAHRYHMVLQPGRKVPLPTPPAPPPRLKQLAAPSHPGSSPASLAHLTQVKNHSRQYKQVPVSGAGTHLSGGYRGGTGQWLADPGLQG